MTELLKQAKEIFASNRTEKASRDLMTNGQRDVLAEDYASNNQFLSASHFHSDEKKRKEFENTFWKTLGKNK